MMKKYIIEEFNNNKKTIFLLLTAIILLTYLCSLYFYMGNSNLEIFYSSQGQVDYNLNNQISSNNSPNIETVTISKAKELPKSNLITKNFKLEKGQSVSSLLQKENIKNNNEVVTHLKNHINFNNIQIGQSFEIIYDENNLINNFKWNITPYKYLSISYDPATSKYDTKLKQIKLSKHLVKSSFIIESNISKSANNAGLPKEVVSQLISNLQNYVDFKKELKNGNHVSLVYELWQNDKKNIKEYGRLLYASVSFSKYSKEICLFKNSLGQYEYFNDKGGSLKSENLIRPLRKFYISSHFGYRHHPFLQKRIFHKGVDLAASVGTPILAAGGGEIVEIGRKGNYGKYIKIKHKNFYTAYAHLQSFSKDLKKGSIVTQGQVIGKVGLTGRTSGPHLHFELIKDNKHVNPMKVKFADSYILKGKTLNQYLSYKNKLQSLSGGSTLIADGYKNNSYQ